MGQSQTSEESHRQQSSCQPDPSATREILFAGSQPTLFSTEEASILRSHLPDRHQKHDVWNLLYNSARDGVSVRTFYNSVMNRGPQFLMIKDQKGYVFGAFVSEAWDKKVNFYGSDECFVFQLKPTLQVYKAASKINRNFMYFNFGNPSHSPIYNGLGIGGQVKFFALELRSEFTSGVSNAHCATFQSPCLASDTNFDVVEIEAWGFPLDAKSEEALRDMLRMQSLIQQKARKVDPKDFIGDMTLMQHAGINIGESGYIQEKLEKHSQQDSIQ